MIDDVPDDARDDDADAYQPDPDAAPTVEGRVSQAADELRKLLRAAVIATIAMGTIIALVDVWRGVGFDATTGFLFGAAAATFNLRLLAGGYFALMRGEAMSARGVLAFLGGFTALVAISLFVVLFHREWTLGYALGLTMPAAAGLVYARSLPR